MNNKVAETSEKYFVNDGVAVASGVKKELQKVPKGYVKTEVGVIPNDWSVKKIGELAEVIRGASPRPKGDKRYYGGKVPRLMVQDVTRDGMYVTPQIDFLTDAGAKLSRPCKAGTLTLVCSGTVVVPAILSVDACIHDGFLALIKLVNGIERDYLYQFFKTQQDKFDNSATHGGVFTNLTTDGVREFLVPIPSTVKEQAAIANTLSDVDALITSLEKLIDKKRAIKTAAMQQLLTGKKRLPPFDTLNNKDGTPRYKQTELGEIPEDWEVVTIGSLCSIMTGNTPPTNKPEYYGEDYLFSSPGDLQGQKYVVDTGKKLSEKGFSICRKYPKASILFTCIGSTIGKCGVAGEELTSNQQINAVLPSEKIDMDYLYYQLLYTAPLIKQQAGEQAVPIVNKTQFSEHRVLVPDDLAEQKSISIYLSDMDSELDTLKQHLLKTQQIKQGMMQELLTGRTRLI